MAGQLGSFYVELTTKGKANILTDVEEIRRALNKSDKEDEKQHREKKKRLTALGVAMEGVRLRTIAAGAAILGFARAGLSGTTHGAALSIRFQQLSREITALFLPAIEGQSHCWDRLPLG
jgi:hypothetical protein